jgi:hypothetical protein
LTGVFKGIAAGVNAEWGCQGVDLPL